MLMGEAGGHGELSAYLVKESPESIMLILLRTLLIHFEFSNDLANIVLGCCVLKDLGHLRKKA